MFMSFNTADLIEVDYENYLILIYVKKPQQTICYYILENT